jgi:ABC-type sugar transport system ATPase subunit
MAFLSFHNLTRRFPGVVALDGVSFDVQAGACHALMGENGAGKSTLGRILAGIHPPDSGEVRLHDTPLRLSSPGAARRLGIAMVHQELAFCPDLSVAENLCLGALPRRYGWVDWARVRARARELLHEIQAGFDVDSPMRQLSTGQEQMVQIAAALGANARILVMDEPTSSLSAAESEALFAVLTRLRSRGITVLYVSHRMEEIFRLCDWITVLRDGRHVATRPVSQTNPGDLVQQMIGRELQAFTPRHLHNPPGEERLSTRDLSSPHRFRNISFRVRSGEILGLAGLVGAGRSDIAAALCGLDPLATGEVRVRGHLVAPGSPPASFAAGLGLVPEDRKRLGLVPSMNCRENTSLAALPGLSRWGWISRTREHALVERHTSRLRVKTPSFEDPVSGLSGGNQQKIALAKWLARDSQVLIVDEPTRGIDVGAKAEIHRLLDELACQGLALLLISSELPEIIALSTRILVIREGTIAGELDRADFHQETILRWMGGYTGGGSCE